MILFTDSIGFDMHFIRFMYWTLLDPTNKPVDLDNNLNEVLFDLGLVCLILVLYIMAAHFMLAPLDTFYDARYQAMVAPISLIPIFYFFNWDILFMGIHTLVLNAYAAYYVMDPSASEEYTWLRAERNDINNYLGSDGIGGQMMGMGVAHTAVSTAGLSRRESRNYDDWDQMGINKFINY